MTSNSPARDASAARPSPCGASQPRKKQRGSSGAAIDVSSHSDSSAEESGDETDASDTSDAPSNGDSDESDEEKDSDEDSEEEQKEQVEVSGHKPVRMPLELISRICSVFGLAGQFLLLGVLKGMVSSLLASCTLFHLLTVFPFTHSLALCPRC